MKASLQLNDIGDVELNAERYICRIDRNLHRIMNIKIADVNVEKHVVSVIYENPKALQLAMDELRRIGYPVKYIIKTTKAKLHKRIKNK